MLHQPLHGPVDEGAEPTSNDRLDRRARAAFLTIGLLVFGLFGLTALLKVGGAVIGAGEIAVESRVMTISHPTGGILIDLAKREGDRVRRGDVLMRFDTSVSGTGFTVANAGLHQLRARRARLEAEREGRATIAFPPALTSSTSADAVELVARERRQFELRRAERDGRIALLREQVEQYEQQIRSYRAQIGAVDAQAVLVRPELEGMRSLYARRLVTINRLNALERTAIDLKGTSAALQAQIAAARARISELREQMLGVDQALRAGAATELAEVIAQLNDQEVRLASASDTFARSTIRAPQSGMIDKIAFTTLGSAVPPGQPLVQIVPDEDVTIVEARIRPDDIDQLHVGQAARVRFSSISRERTPELDGRLTFVSPERAEDPTTATSFYRIRVSLDKTMLQRALQRPPAAGMPVEVFLQTGNRSILSYLTKPLMDQITRAFRED